MGLRGLHLGILMAVAAGSEAQAQAQADPRTATLGQLLSAEDRRAYDPVLFESSLRSADPIVRRQATLGAGRIQDHRAGPALLALLESPDTTGHADAMFALGLLGDSSVTGHIVARLTDSRPLANGAVVEAPATLAKLGTGQARTLFSRLLDGTSRAVSPGRRRLMVPELLVEGWRFGRLAPVRAALPHLTDSSDAVRWKAAYLLGRTRAAVGTRALLAAAGDPNPWVRQHAVRGLTRAAADSASLPRDSILPVLLAGLQDSDEGVRINATISLGSWQESTTAASIAALLRDPVPNVRMQAVIILAGLPGAEAGAAVLAVGNDGRAPLSIRREAWLGVLRTDTTRVRAMAAQFAVSPEPRVRELAVELAFLSRSRDTLVFDPSPEATAFAALIHDPDPGVRASAMGSLGALSINLDAEIMAAVNALLEDDNDRLRGAAWSQYARKATSAHFVPTLVQGWQQESARGARGTTAPIVGALRRIYETGGEGRQAVEAQFLAATTPPTDYLLLRQAANWPALLARWGAAPPAPVRYTATEYQALAERWLLSAAAGYRVVVGFETEGQGRVEVELLGHQAPLTVANFLGLVDRAAFDGGEWHRVVPNFVVQDGAGPRDEPLRGVLPIRDEFNRVRYDTAVLGMALSGPNTGTSQWFINLSPQPHLDGGYTVFGRVVGGQQALAAILQGDVIRSISRR